ncbi:MAG: hypothetical protein K6C40_11910 [Thermoguttaceae bacterium]|nr:hypothetical protein [Thermoguttaceae bacterium]
MTQFEYSCPNDHSVKFILEMCGRTAQCPKCSARFEVPTLEEVREMLGDDITPELEKEFQEAKKKLEAHAKAKAKRAQAAAQSSSSSQLHEFEFECPNGDQVKFTLEMCGHTAKCPKCGIRFDVPKLEFVREMLEGQIDEELEEEFKNAEVKYQEFLKAKALKRAQLEKEKKEKAEKEEEKAEQKKAAQEKAEQEAKEKAEQEKAEQEAKEKAESEAKENEEKVKKPLDFQFAFGMDSSEESSEEPTEESSEEMISFLCPNGHQLEAPVSSAGKKGKCPECGAKFKVPTMESLEETSQGSELELNPEGGLSLDEIQASEQTKAFTDKESKVLPPKITISKDSTEKPFLYPNLAIGKTGEIDLGLDETIQSIPEAVKMDPMAKFFWTLWTSGAEPAAESGKTEEGVKDGAESDGKPEESPEEKADGKPEEKEEKPEQNDFRANIIGSSIKSSQAGKIEIQTADGKIFTPMEFYEDRSLSRIGYFEALDEKERPITLVIRWENVVRIVVKK